MDEIRGMASRQRSGSVTSSRRRSSIRSIRTIRDLRDVVLSAKDTKSRKLASFKLGKYPKGRGSLEVVSFVSGLRDTRTSIAKGAGNDSMLQLNREKRA